MRDTYDTAARLVQLARDSKVRRVVVDLRNNGGGEIRTYPPLLGALRGR
jgi:C-terminal processing protease CtpA/Prc